MPFIESNSAAKSHNFAAISHAAAVALVKNGSGTQPFIRVNNVRSDPFIFKAFTNVFNAIATVNFNEKSFLLKE